MTYALVKHVHVAAVAITFALFCLRGFWTLRKSHALHRGWVRVAPHVNDTVLLAAALYLASFHGLRPWILAKVADQDDLVDTSAHVVTFSWIS